MIERALAGILKSSRVGFDHMPVFFNFIPEDVNVAAMIDTPIPGYEIDPDLPGYYNDITEVVIRHVDPEKGFDLCRATMSVLNVINQQHGGYHFNYVRPVSEPTAYPLSNGGMREFAMRFEFSCYRVN